jgi:starch phosphorylase
LILIPESLKAIASGFTDFPFISPVRGKTFCGGCMKAHVSSRDKLVACDTFDRTSLDAAHFKRAFKDNLHFRLGQAAYTANPHDLYMALAHTVRDYLSVRWMDTMEAYYAGRPKFVYYLSAEYLPGRQMLQNLMYTGTLEIARDVFDELELNFEEILAMEAEPGLGNGGLGRLASCFMDSMASLDIPAVGYGIRYDYGIFKQSFKDGWQVESPDEWLTEGNPWEFVQTNHIVEVKFGGHTEHWIDEEGRFRVSWHPNDTVRGEPYHTLVPGYGTKTVNLLRLWRARASEEFDFQLFNEGDFMRAVSQKTLSENISKVLYPNDNTPQGRELRLRQQYFFVACSLKNILARYQAFQSGWEGFSEKVVIQLNDTHPTIAIAEMMRLLMDEHGMGWTEAWKHTSRIFAYTCHTLMPEALERWPVPLMQSLLPRHMEIIYEINAQFLEDVRKRFPGDQAKLSRLSIIEESGEKLIRMANLACVGCFSINGVAALHTELLKNITLKDFYDLWPDKFNNKTNGISPRRFMLISNPALSGLLDKTCGSGWESDLTSLKKLEKQVNNAAFRAAWRDIKQSNKMRLADYLQRSLGVEINPDSMFDVMVKRLHEYKRQTLKVLHIISLYRAMLSNPGASVIPRIFIFGAKAAPGYRQAKLIIKLINDVSATLNADQRTNHALKVVYIPNFNVSAGELVYPAADLSEQISMAGTEASGTGNMKFALNGALTVGTLDGANIEIREAVGSDHFFHFGLTTGEVHSIKAEGYRPFTFVENDAALRGALEMIASGYFSGGSRETFQPLTDHLLYHDDYLVLADFRAYLDAQERVEALYRNQEEWTKSSILNVARSHSFSSDRSIRDYCRDIWGIKPLQIQATSTRKKAALKKTT